MNDRVCTKCCLRKPLEAFYKKSATPLGVTARCKECYKQYGIDFRKSEKYSLYKERKNARRRADDPIKSLFANAKRRARVKNLEFSLKIGDLDIPSTCPVLGIPLQSHIDYANDNSPSIDRIDPLKGYTVENTRIISHRANRIKSNATIDEIKCVLEYMLKHQ